MNPALARLLRAGRDGFKRRFGGAAHCSLGGSKGGRCCQAWAPGRINVIGEHTDYTEGLALPSAIDRWIVVTLRPRRDRRVRVWSADFEDRLETDLDAGPDDTGPSWRRFVLGAVQVFHGEHELPSGFEAHLQGNVPREAGVSSSAALLVAWMNVLRFWTEGETLDDGPLGGNQGGKHWQMVHLSRRVENEVLGVATGLLDQVASQFSRSGSLILVDFRDLSLTYVPSGGADLVWVLLHCGKARQLTASAYSERVRECREGLAAVRARHPEVGHYRDLRLDHLDGDGVPMRRLRHFVTENGRVRRAAEHLAAGRIAELGALLDQSHHSLAGDYAVSCAEIDALVELARAHPACLGARIMGGGFGGCSLNLVRPDGAQDFAASVLDAYRRRFDLPAFSMTARLADGAGAFDG